MGRFRWKGWFGSGYVYPGGLSELRRFLSNTPEEAARLEEPGWRRRERVRGWKGWLLAVFAAVVIAVAWLV